MVSDWAHESSQAVGTRYLTRIGTFEQVVPKDQVNKYDEVCPLFFLPRTTHSLS